MSLFAGAVSRPELRFTELLVPRIMIAGTLGFLVAWFVVAIMEHTCLSRYVWHIPLLFLALIVLFSSLQCRCRSPPNHGKGRRAWMVRVVSGFVFAVRLMVTCCLVPADVQRQGEADLFPGKGGELWEEASGKRPDPSACDRRPTG